MSRTRWASASAASYASASRSSTRAATRSRAVSVGRRGVFSRPRDARRRVPRVELVVLVLADHARRLRADDDALHGLVAAALLAALGRGPTRHRRPIERVAVEAHAARRRARVAGKTERGRGANGGARRARARERIRARRAGDGEASTRGVREETVTPTRRSDENRASRRRERHRRASLRDSGFASLADCVRTPT